MPEKKYTRSVNIVDIYKNPIICLPDLQQFSSNLWICLLLCSIMIEIHEREAFIQKSLSKRIRKMLLNWKILRRGEKEMFCAKCGAMINEEDRFCPKCGAKNENCKKSLIKPVRNPDTGMEGKKQEGEIAGSTGEDTPNRSRRVRIIIPAALIAAVIIVSIIVLPRLLKGSGKVEYSNIGMQAYIDEKGTAYFIGDAGTVVFEGEMKECRTTPDHSKYILLGTDGTLSCSTGEKKESAQIADDVRWMGRVGNKGCYYYKNDSSLYYYNFEKKKETKVGFEGYSVAYSSAAVSAAEVDENGQLYLFSDGDESPEKLCNVDENAEICAVADNGSNVIWHVDDGESINVYMIINDIPERIGILKNEDRFYSVYGEFFADDKSLVVYSPGSTTMLVAIDGGDVEEITLPGVKGYGSFFDSEGNKMDSADDNLSEFYFTVYDIEDSYTQSIYKWAPGGKMTQLASDIAMDNLFSYMSASDYYLVKDQIYYVDSNGDFCKKKAEADLDEKEKITTEVEAVYIPKAGEYAYIIKSGSVYYLDLKDKSKKLNLVCNDFSEDDLLYTTDKSNVIYYITKKTDIDDSYSHKGTLYRYTVGEEPLRIAEDVMSLMRDDLPSYISSSAPVICQYVSHKDIDFVVNFGTIENDKFVVKAQNAER